ncbi:DNA-directed RNA polymerase III subunit RPC7 isoform X1 [Triplophysa rosa]|uniref:DNA-directed RNA polymerase III subunit RPC7 n=2 Tax=Triplophysa rosa TaxID=992332 RepID=A0A9W7WA66_TRIRA|nr:DNA-directed RNA polymerase III subunit RPC7 isoform X1 [Triplophysa rosa]XP_057184552.1 DNA-directed RNA polymerase III subunit RPC7 isoform X1 [Triplophysa rosa]KAI7790668.1 putative DNA-directed RNA polymerase III subunit RPC7 [Triplophysa rosa]
MAGKGRGIAAFTFNIEALGITRGSMPEAQRGPTPLFPQIEYKPGPLKAGEDEDYMRALKQEMRGRMKDLPFNIKPHSGKSDVERYKDKYTREIKKIEDGNWTPDWNRLPKELKPQRNIIKKKMDFKKFKEMSKKDKEDMLSKLDELDKRGDGKSDEEDEAKGEKKGDGEEEEIEGNFEEEELEEDNDYIANYFEDGDDFGAGSDDNMDEATY